MTGFWLASKVVCLVHTDVNELVVQTLSTLQCISVPCFFTLVRVCRTLGVDFGCKTVEVADRRVRLQMVNTQSKLLYHKTQKNFK